MELLEVKQHATGGTSTKDEVMADAQMRSEPAMTGGYEDGKFILRSRDGSWDRWDFQASSI